MYVIINGDGVILDVSIILLPVPPAAIQHSFDTSTLLLCLLVGMGCCGLFALEVSMVHVVHKAWYVKSSHAHISSSDVGLYRVKSCQDKATTRSFVHIRTQSGMLGSGYVAMILIACDCRLLNVDFFCTSLCHSPEIDEIIRRAPPLVLKTCTPGS